MIFFSHLSLKTEIPPPLHNQVENQKSLTMILKRKWTYMKIVVFSNMERKTIFM